MGFAKEKGLKGQTFAKWVKGEKNSQIQKWG